MSVDLTAVEERYCAASPDVEPPDPDLVAVFAALRAGLAVLARQEQGSPADALRASRVRWAIERHVGLGVSA